MVSILSSVGDHLYAWLQACPCHRGEALKRLHREFGVCPMAGRRLPELAAGALETFARDLFAVAYQDVLRVTRGVGPQDLTALLNDFEFGRQHMLVHIRMKGFYHSDLPLLISILGHCDLPTACRGARRCVDIWRALPAEHQVAAHPVARRFMQAHLDDLHAFMDERAGMMLADFPDMEIEVLKLVLDRVDERDAERPHALMQKELYHSPGSSASHLSLALRLPIWESTLQDRPTDLAKVANHMQSVYNADAASVVLKLHAHPSIASFLQQQVVSSSSVVVSSSGWLVGGSTTRC